MMRGHVARLEVNFGDAAVVTSDEAIEDFREELALLHSEPAHDAEIDRHQPSVAIDEQLARVHVGVEEAIAQRVAQEILDHLAPECRQIDAGGFQPGAIVERDAFAPFRRENMMAGAVPIDGWYANVG